MVGDGDVHPIRATTRKHFEVSMNLSREIGRVVFVLWEGRARQAVKYLSPTFVVKATRRGLLDRRAKTMEVVVTIGRPGYREHKFIKQTKKAGEPFPVKKIQLRPEKKRFV